MIENCGLNNAIVRISRRGPMEPKSALCCDMSVRDFDFDNVRKIYGGGEFTFTLLNSEGKYVKSRRILIDPRIKGELDRQAESQGHQQTIVRPDNSSGLGSVVERLMSKVSEDNRVMLQMQMENNRSQIAVLAEALKSRGSGADGLRLKDLLMSLPPLIQMMGGRSGGKTLEPMEFLEMMKMAKEMFAEGNGGGSSAFDKFLEAAPGFFQKMMDSRVNGAVAVAAPAIEDQRQILAPAGQQTIPPVAPNPNGRPINPPPAAAQTDLGKILEICIGAARRGSDINIYVDLVLDAVPEVQLPQLENVLTQDEWFEQMFSTLADREQLRPWLTELRNEILADLHNESDDQPAGDEPVKPGGDNPPGV